MKAMYASLLALALLLCALPLAQAEGDLYSEVLPLIDAAAQKAFEGENAEGYVGMRPMGCDVTPEGDAAAVLGDLYAAKAPLDTLTPEEYGQVRWLDKRAVAQLQKEENGAWKLISFDLDAELQMEDAAQAYFGETMHIYSNEHLGFSVQYPAVFTSAMKETENGASAQLEDCSFLVERYENKDGQTVMEIAEKTKAAHADAKLEINDVSGTARVTWRSGGKITAETYLATEDGVYHASLSWEEALRPDFSRYSDYMMNSFSVDELGIG